MKALKILGIIIGVIVLIIFGIAVYLGYVPAVSKAIGLGKPKVLGITYTQSDLDGARTKFGTELLPISNPSSPRDSMRYEGVTPIDASFSSSEITALINNNNWIYMPVKDVQFKINNDNSIEASGILRLSVLPNYFEATGTASAGTAEAMKYAKYLPSEASFYISGTASVTDNEVTIKPTETRISYGGLLATQTYAANVASGNVSAFSAGSFNISQSILEKYQSAISAFLTARINSITNTKLNGDFSAGKMNLKGTIPAKKYSQKE